MICVYVVCGGKWCMCDVCVVVCTTNASFHLGDVEIVNNIVIFFF